jgi:O-antigen/teichoic acid export membrane protein
MLALAWATHSVWALACAAIGTSSARLVLGYTLLPGPGNRLRWDRSAVRTLSRFGRWMFPSTMLTFFATSSDRLIFGKFISIGQLGVYSIAAIWAAIPVFVLGHVFSNVVFPLLSRARNEGHDVGTWFHSTRRPVVIAAAWLTTCLVAGGPTGMLFLYNERAADAGWIVQILALGAWLHALENGNSNAVLALGQPKWLAAANGAKVAGMLVLIPCGFYLGRKTGFGGFSGAVWGFALSDALKCGVSMIATSRAGISAWRQDLMLSACIALIAAFGALAGKLAARAALPLLVQGIAIFIVATIPWAMIYRRGAQARMPVVAGPTPVP